MTILKPSACIVLLGVAFVLTTSCDGDDDTVSGAGTGGGGGHAGAGAAGKSGRGGSSSGGAGEAGMGAESAGGGGRSGSSHGGGAGEAASSGAGAAGEGPSTGGTGAVSGTGGSAGSPEGGNPSSGGAGMGGAGGEEQASHKQCGRTCETTADCPTQTFCQVELHRCIECNDHTDCIPNMSGGMSSCAVEDDCLTILGEVCVDINGRGYCAAGYDAGAGCEAPNVHTTLTKFGTTDTVDVCVVNSGRCENHVCSTCASSPDFCTTTLTGYGDTCDAETGHCTCVSDDECTHGPSHCDPATHRCVECSENAHCPGAAVGKDTCVDGHCGCSSAEVCPTEAPGGSAVCE